MNPFSDLNRYQIEREFEKTYAAMERAEKRIQTTSNGPERNILAVDVRANQQRCRLLHKARLELK